MNLTEKSYKRFFVFFLFVLFLFLPLFKSLANNHVNFKAKAKKGRLQKNSWESLINKLRKDGISEKDLKVYKKLPPFKPFIFSVVPKEPASWYEKFYKEKILIKRAKAFLSRYKEVFREVEKKYGVSPHIITSILLVETRLGSSIGKNLVLYKLSQLALADLSENINKNIAYWRNKDKTVTSVQLKKRANALKKIFYPQLLDLFKAAKKHNLDILSLKGSYSGAFGLPQFMPSSLLKYGVDGNQDGKVSLFDEIDAIYSVANYLKVHGWKTGLPPDVQTQVILSYNNSKPYGEAVLKVAELLK